MTILRFFYEHGAALLPDHEAVIRSAVQVLASELSLPPELEVCLYTLPAGTWGGIDHQRSNRLAIDRNTELRRLVPLLVHELVHIDQQQQGLLERRGLGWWWRGQMIFDRWPLNLTTDSYLSLPWEADARARTPGLVARLVGTD